MVYRAQVNDRGTARGGPLHLAEVKKIVTVGLIEANDVMTEVRQMLGYWDADVAPVASDQNAHAGHALADRGDLSPAPGVGLRWWPEKPEA